MPSGLLAMEIPTAQLDLSLFSNTAMLLTAIVGEIIYVSNR
jgi:hypothetical protein